MSKSKATVRNKSLQLCWSCRHAVPHKGNGCPWAMRYEPVPRWRAKKTKIQLGNDRKMASYQVRTCPLFEEG